MEANEKVMILDEYECLILFDRIRVTIDGLRDPSLADIMSEIHNVDGRIYFDGSYYQYINQYDIINMNGFWYLDLFTKN